MNLLATGIILDERSKCYLNMVHDTDLDNRDTSRIEIGYAVKNHYFTVSNNDLRKLAEDILDFVHREDR